MKKPRGIRNRDPHLEREQARYDQPLPSREFILDIMTEAGVPLQDADLAKILEIRKEESLTFTRRLAAMEREGQILRNRKGAILVAQKLALLAGRVEAHPDGFGFFVPDSGAGDGDLYLSPREMQKVMHRDRVMVREAGLDRRGRREASIVEVIEHANATVVGKFQQQHSVYFVTAADRRIARPIGIPDAEKSTAKLGDVVVVEIIVQPDPDKHPIGRVIEVLGQATDPGMEIEIALRKHAVPFKFSEKVELQAERYGTKVQKADEKGRLDLRALPLITIDGETARDFDDAVWAEQQGQGFRLIVAIADVSHYVRHGDPLDGAARERGTSIYFPRRVIPMLPENLSNGLCSLNPDVDRLCVACDMEISPSGEIKRYSFHPAIMRSKARLTYTQAWDVLSGSGAEHAPNVISQLPRLQALYGVFQVLLKARERRGAIDFETTETRIVFDDEGKIDRIVPVPRNDAHRLIEECMLAANVSASNFLAKAGHQALFRIHEGPTEEKLAALREFLKEFGLHLQGGEKPSAMDYAKLLTTTKTRPDALLLQTVLLRSLQQAQYSPENVGHFGLSYEAYTHFTSPIRRYPDLIIHRAIKAVLSRDSYSPGNWRELGAHCSQTERRADEASREVESWLKCYYMRNRVGDEFEGTISGVAGFGIFVALDGIYVEGMVHISELGSDYFLFDSAKHQLLGERTGRRFRLGDRIRIKIARVDLESSRIDFVLVSNADAESKARKMKPEKRISKGRK